MVCSNQNRSLVVETTRPVPRNRIPEMSQNFEKNILLDGFLRYSRGRVEEIKLKLKEVKERLKMQSQTGIDLNQKTTDLYLQGQLKDQIAEFETVVRVIEREVIDV